MNRPPDILKKILARKTEEIAARTRRLPLNELSKRAASAPVPRGFVQAIQNRIVMGRAAVIAEIKKASPSKGILRADFHPAERALKAQLCLPVPPRSEPVPPG